MTSPDEQLERLLLALVAEAAVDPDRVLVIAERLVALEPARSPRPARRSPGSAASRRARSSAWPPSPLRSRGLDEALADRPLVLEPGAERAVEGAEVLRQLVRLARRIRHEGVLQQHDLRPRHLGMGGARRVEARPSGSRPRHRRRRAASPARCSRWRRRSRASSDRARRPRSADAAAAPAWATRWSRGTTRTRRRARSRLPKAA